MEVASPPESGEACHGKGSNERIHLAGLPGWKGTARANRSVEEPERPGTAAGSSSADRDRESIT
jgi:hypothetical protein